MPTRFPSWLPAAILVVGSSLSGCAQGGGAGGDNGVSVVARGADRTLGAHTFRFETTMGGDGQPMVVSGTADLDRKVEGTAFGRGGFPPDFITTEDGKSYQRREMLPRSLDVKTPWAVTDTKAMLASLGAESGGSGGMTVTTRERRDAMAFDPATMLDNLRKTAERVDRTGTDVVRGVPTTRYAATLKPHAPPPDTSIPGGPAVQEAVTIWVGDDGLVRRMENRTTFPAADNSPAQSLVFTTEFFDFGVPVDVQVPAPSETTDITDRLGASFRTVPAGTTESSSVRSWSTVTTGAVGSSRWTFQQGKASDGAICTRLRLNPPVQVPSFPSLPTNLTKPPPLALPDGTLVPPPPALPDGTLVPPPPALPDGTLVLPPPLALPDGTLVPPPPPIEAPFPPSVAGELAESSTVPGTGVGCDDLMMSSQGFAADAGGLGWFFGVVPPGAEQATAHFAGGAETPLVFHDGLFVLVYPAAQRLERVVFTRHGQPFRTCERPPDDFAVGSPLC